MAKEKRIVRRPWGRKKLGGWIIQPDELRKALKGGNIAEMGKIHVGAKQLSELVRLMNFPDQELLITTNGRLEVCNMARVRVNGYTKFRKPKLNHSFRVDDGAWVLNRHAITVVIKPRNFNKGVKHGKKNIPIQGSQV